MQIQPRQEVHRLQICHLSEQDGHLRTNITESYKTANKVNVKSGKICFNSA